MRGKELLSEFLLLLIFLKEVSGLKIRNKLLGKCLQVQEGATGGQASLGECRPGSSVQEWRWLPKVQALSSLHTGECLTAPTEEQEGIVLRPCIFKDRAGGEDVEREVRGQAWTCTKKGHITLIENRLHLSASKDSTLVFLLREHKQQGSKWRALHNQTLCNGRDTEENPNQLYHHVEGKKTNISESPLSERHMQVKTYEGILDSEWTEAYSVKDVTIPFSLITKSPADPTMVFFTMDYGMGWKITMLVLSSMALVLGAIILILNVYSNRRRKVVCVLKSYTPTPEMSIPGSPAPNERAALTEHAMHFPHSSPSLPRGEILIEWKDGTVTPLYEA
ncbi:uncharacterized protein si:dkey-245n4.2 isoform X1 [Poeciliopsis prolifica]|uniref:uncharacterized protein si:dkey-245n4.2 isoform X1 n=1 Tax=Poeciliopsis prolifica TaxID=188132 RepID=UPI00241379F4|nr:uncharacterized protein si:dkey-245n4.2 isoform X1 [Poeciliopsis prolifica]